VSCPVVSCRVLSCPVVSCRVLSCPVASCPVVSCPVPRLPTANPSSAAAARRCGGAALRGGAGRAFLLFGPARTCCTSAAATVPTEYPLSTLYVPSTYPLSNPHSGAATSRVHEINALRSVALGCAALRCTVGFSHGGVACKRLAAIPPRDTELTSSSEFSADVGTDDALLPRRVCCAPIAASCMLAVVRCTLHVARCTLYVVRCRCTCVCARTQSPSQCCVLRVRAMPVPCCLLQSL
jgi:hypothetical protein